jgi:pimeloyl-ACP methyl ester carboxylesterase
MKDFFTTSLGRRVCFWDSGGDGDAILLIHGNSSSKNTFENQFESPVLSHHRLVALDLPGHGSSEWAGDYNQEVYFDALASVIRQLGLTGVVVVGHSLGGNIAVEAIRSIPEAIGVAVFGTPLLSKPPEVHKALLPHPSSIAFFTGDLSERDYANWAQTCFRTGFRTPDHFVANIRNTDPNVRVRLAQHLMALNYDDEIECVKRAGIPIAILHGEFENTVSGSYLEGLNLPRLWRDRVVIIEGAGHSPHIETPESFNMLIDDFVSDLRAIHVTRAPEMAAHV